MPDTRRTETLLAVAILLSILFTFASGQETFIPVDGLYRRSESSGAITYTPVTERIYQRGNQPRPPSPNPPDVPPTPEPDPDLSTRAREFRAVVVQINDPPNAIVLDQLISVLIQKSESLSRAEITQATDLVISQGVPAAAMTRWTPFVNLWKRYRNEIVQRNSIQLLKDMSLGLRAFSLTDQQAIALVDADSGSMGWYHTVAAVEVIQKAGGGNLERILKMLLCILGAENPDFRDIIRCILEGI